MSSGKPPENTLTIVHPEIEAYLQQHAPVPHPVLEEMEQIGRQRNFPIVGPLVGRLLAVLVRFGHVHTILECGSGFGYSAMWMALALPENGRMICIEYNEENIALAKEFFEKANLVHKVSFMAGNALDLIDTFSQTFDLIVNDVEKPQYPRLLPKMLRRLRVGGMLISDNVLWSGRVVKEAKDESTRAIQEFNRMLIEDPALFTSFIPLRDGLSLSIKLRTGG